MKTYTIEAITTEGEIQSVTLRAKNIYEAVKDSSCLSAPVFRYEGRKGEWNEYVEFDPRRTNGVTFIAQKGAGGRWFVFENYPGKKGAVITHANYGHKYLAVNHARRMAHS